MPAQDLAAHLQICAGWWSERRHGLRWSRQASRFSSVLHRPVVMMDRLRNDRPAAGRRGQVGGGVKSRRRETGQRDGPGQGERDESGIDRAFEDNVVRRGATNWPQRNALETETMEKNVSGSQVIEWNNSSVLRGLTSGEVLTRWTFRAISQEFSIGKYIYVFGDWSPTKLLLTV